MPYVQKFRVYYFAMSTHHKTFTDVKSAVDFANKQSAEQTLSRCENIMVEETTIDDMTARLFNAAS